MAKSLIPAAVADSLRKNNSKLKADWIEAGKNLAILRRMNKIRQKTKA
ncbi:MAG TPA: hypothetical protein VMH87_20600 [Pseudomonadales bacterium]|nr:hypothetical protein [Pseudomonadales bacterium]